VEDEHRHFDLRQQRQRIEAVAHEPPHRIDGETPRAHIGNGGVGRFQDERFAVAFACHPRSNIAAETMAPQHNGPWRTGKNRARIVHQSVFAWASGIARIAAIGREYDAITMRVQMLAGLREIRQVAGIAVEDDKGRKPRPRGRCFPDRQLGTVILLDYHRAIDRSRRRRRDDVRVAGEQELSLIDK